MTTSGSARRRAPSPDARERTMIKTTERGEIADFLHALAGPVLAGGLTELRERHGQLMRRRFFPAEHPDRAARAILRAAPQRDVYVGAAIRACAEGGRAAIHWLSSFWVDADIPEAIERLAEFTPAPSIVIGSGRGQHAYWLLEHPVDLDTGEEANRRLAQALAADPSCHDAARILRPPHTLNHGYDAPRPVTLLHFEPHDRHEPQALVDALPELSQQRQAPRHARRDREDPLLALDPAFYVRALLGVEVGHDRKVSCPFHTDKHPSLHVYPSAAEGWHCFSCRRGGTVYDLAAPLFGLAPRGASFLRLRATLHALLL